MPQPDELAVALARLGALQPTPEVNIRPVLLRAAVDLFLQRGFHAPADLHTFEAMVGPLLDQADPQTRRMVGEKLTRHSQTPQSLLDRLVDERMLAAAEMFRHAPLDEADMLAAVEQGPVTVAVMIAHRPDVPGAVAAALADRPEPLIALALASNRKIDLDRSVLQRLIQRARVDAALADRLAGRPGDLAELAPLFPLLGPKPRREIIAAIVRLDLGRREWGRPDSATAATVSRLDRLVLSGEWEGFDDTLCTALACEETTLRPLLHDGTGDILALALAAVGAPGEMAARAFILGDPAIGRSVAAVRRLTALVDQIAPAAARRLIGSMLVEADKPLRRTPAPGKPVASPRRAEPSVAEPMAPRRAVADSQVRRRAQ